jgi:hypothetical protein
MTWQATFSRSPAAAMHTTELPPGEEREGEPGDGQEADDATTLIAVC